MRTARTVTTTMSRRRFRERLPFTPRHEQYFHWRGREVSRLEGLTDATFGFAVTLLVVALEVPKTFAGLMTALREFPAFVACFSLLMLFWNAHYRFFRRYGMEDMFVRMVNYGIILLVLFSVYPLKFLFSSWLGTRTVAPFENANELFYVYRIYGVGLAGIWALFALLYWHAWRKREILQLTPTERVLTRLDLNGFLINVGVCGLSILLSYVQTNPWAPGFIYASLGPLLAANGFWHGAKVTKLMQAQQTRNG